MNWIGGFFLFSQQRKLSKDCHSKFKSWNWDAYILLEVKVKDYISLEVITHTLSIAFNIEHETMSTFWTHCSILSWNVLLLFVCWGKCMFLNTIPLSCNGHLNIGVCLRRLTTKGTYTVGRSLQGYSHHKCCFKQIKNLYYCHIWVCTSLSYEVLIELMHIYSNDKAQMQINM